MGMTTTGIDEYERLLTELPVRVQKSIARNAMRKATRLLAKRVKKMIGGEAIGSSGKPLGQVTGNLLRGVKSVTFLQRDGTRVIGIAGFKYGSSNAPHAHLVEWGTKRRVTKAGQNRGVMPSYWAVRKSGEETGAACQQLIETAMVEGMDREAQKILKGG
jgi:hypothetical protein